MDNYKYKAFISYRHIQFDSLIAQNILELIERYKPPAKFRKGEKWTHWKCFRDEEELPASKDLGDDIHAALEQSEFLVVICSKDLKDSLWCKEEIQYFKLLHGGSTDNIVPVLINGEPETSFVDEMINSVKNDKECTVEPLATDIRADSVKKSLSLLKTRYLKMIARFLDCGYDNLVRRESRRKRNKLIAVFSVITVILTIIIGIILTSYFKLREKNNELLIENSHHLVEEARNLARDKRPVEAIETALKALPDEGNDRPVLPEAEYCLGVVLDAFSPYDYTYGAVKKLEHKSPVLDIAYVKNGEQIFTYDMSGMYFWDRKSGELLKKIKVNLGWDGSSVHIDRQHPSDTEPGIYLYDDYSVALYDCESENFKWKRTYDSKTNIWFDEKNIIASTKGGRVEFVHKETGSLITFLNDKEGYFSGEIILDNKEYAIIKYRNSLYSCHKSEKGYDSVISCDIQHFTQTVCIDDYILGIETGNTYTMYAYDVQSLDLLWEKELKNSDQYVYTSNAIIGWNVYNRNGNFIVAASENKIYLIDCKNGETVKSCELDENITDIEFYDDGTIRFTAGNDYSANIYKVLDDDSVEIDYDFEIALQSQADRICRTENSCATAEEFSNVVYIYEKRPNPDHQSTDFIEMKTDMKGNYALARKSWKEEAPKYLYHIVSGEIIAAFPSDAEFSAECYVVYSNENGTVAYNYETGEYSYDAEAGFIQAGKSRCSYKVDNNTITLKTEDGSKFSWTDDYDTFLGKYSPDGKKIMMLSSYDDPCTITVHSFEDNKTLELTDAYIKDSVWVDSDSILLWGSDDVFYEYDALTGELISKCSSYELFDAAVLMVTSLDTDNCVGVLCDDGLFSCVDMSESSVTGEIDFKNVGEERISFGINYDPKLNWKIYPQSNILIIEKFIGTGWIDAWIIDTESFGLRHVIYYFREYAEGANMVICATPDNKHYLYPLYTTEELVEKAKNYLS